MRGLEHPEHEESLSRLTPKQLQDTKNLLRSYLWRAKWRRTKPFIVSFQKHVDQLIDYLKAYDLSATYGALSFEQVVAQADSLTFIAKAMKTLENIDLLWSLGEEGMLNSVSSKMEHIKTHNTDGLVYGANNQETGSILEYLKDQHLVISDGVLTRPSAKGMIELEKIRRGKEASIREAFFVRKYDEELDKFLEPILRAVGASLQCEINPVWAQEHIEKIDERIFRKINESSVIVVDITGDRFNVGLELGYALALGKPIVAIKEHSDPNAKFEVPFDISTLNCFPYQQTPEGAILLKEKLEARIGIALDMMKLK